MYHRFSARTRGRHDRMSEVKGMKKTLWLVFLIAELIMWVVFLSADIRNAFDTTWLKYASILMVMCVLRHHSNISRLLNGTENKLGNKVN